MTRATIASVVFGLALALTACAPKKPPARPPAPTGPPPAPHVVQGDLDASVLLGDLPARAAKLGAGPLSIVASSESVAGERLGAFVDLPADACLLAYARGSTAVEDIDIAAFDDEGNPVALDEERDAHPTVLLCPPHPARVYVAAHVEIGEGLVAVGAQLVATDHAAEVGRALQAHGALGEAPRPADSWIGLDDHVRAHHEAIGGQWEEVKRVLLTLDARAPTVVTLSIDADRCLDAVIVPSDEVALLQVEALDASGQVVARAREGGGDRTLTLCSPIAFEGSLIVRPHIGRGLAAVVTSRARGEVARDLGVKPDLLWVAPVGSLASARAEREGALAHAGYGVPGVASTGSLTVGRRVTVPVDLLHGGCTRVDVVAGAPLALVGATLWTAASDLVATDEGVAGSTLFACASGKAQLDVEAHGRGGPFAVVVRGEKWKDPAFAAHPLAASRMMTRLAGGPARIFEGNAKPARALTLDPAKRTAWTESLTAGQCAEVAVGTEGPGEGIELRVFDQAGGDELDRSHASRAASVRACAPETAAREVRVELRATSGQVDAIVGERIK